MQPWKDLQGFARDAPGSAAVAVPDITWTARQLLDAAESVAARLAAEGVQPGDRVTLQAGNDLGVAAVVFACFKLHVVLCPLNARWTATEVADALARLQPAVHIASAAHESSVDDQTRLGCLRLRPGTSQLDRVGRAGGGSTLMQGLARGVDPAPALLLATSGSTGRAKFVVHTAASLSATVDRMTGGLRGPERLALCPLPLMHAGGLLANLLTYVRLRSPLLLLDAGAFGPAEVLAVIERSRATYVNAFPALLDGLVQEQERTRRDIDALERVVVAGDALPAEAQLRAASVLGAEIRQVWGATEAMGSFVPGQRPGSLGRPAADVRLRLLDHDGGETAPPTPGELVIGGDHVAAGYWEDGRVVPLSSDAAYHSGDLVQIDPDGDVWFVARMKDLIVRAGSNIAPAEVEAVLEADRAVREALVAGVPDRQLGERVGALVVLEPRSAQGSQTDQLRGVLRRAAARLAAYKLPDQLVAVEELPRTPTTKRDRARAAQILADRRLPIPSTAQRLDHRSQINTTEGTAHD